MSAFRRSQAWRNWTFALWAHKAVLEFGRYVTRADGKPRYKVLTLKLDCKSLISSRVKFHLIDPPQAGAALSTQRFGAMSGITRLPCLRYTPKSLSMVSTEARSFSSASRTRHASASDIGRSAYLAQERPRRHAPP